MWPGVGPSFGPAVGPPPVREGPREAVGLFASRLGPCGDLETSPMLVGLLDPRARQAFQPNHKAPAASSAVIAIITKDRRFAFIASYFDSSFTFTFAPHCARISGS